ncbi:MAG: LysM peptidoglycan-binding domain-containing protein [Pseudomonadota bacterium]
MSDSDRQPDEKEDKSYAGFAVLLGAAVVAAILFPAAIEILDGPPPEATQTVDPLAEATPAGVAASGAQDAGETVSVDAGENSRTTEGAAEKEPLQASNASQEALSTQSLAPVNSASDTSSRNGNQNAGVSNDAGLGSDAQSPVASLSAKVDQSAAEPRPDSAPLASGALGTKVDSPLPRPGVSEDLASEVAVLKPRPSASGASNTDNAPQGEAEDDGALALEGQDASDTDDTGQVAKAPEFDLVRVDPDGAALIAGTASPNAPVAIVVDGLEIARTFSGADGAFVAFADLEARTAPQVITLIEAPDSSPAPSIEDIVVALAPAPVQPKTKPAETVEDLVAQPVILKATPQGVALLQPELPLPPPKTAPKIDTAAALGTVEAQETPNIGGTAAPLSLDAISYSTTGRVQLAGRTAQEGTLRIYLNNALLTETRVERGAWNTGLPEIDPGTYTLRVDRVREDGSVASRVETPFQREEPSVLAKIITEAPEFTIQTVQPGATLWAIARERYGEGIQYLKVFDANRDRISNPDLIYPGQVFTIPN